MSQRRRWDRAQARGTAPMTSSSSTLSAPPSLEQKRYLQHHIMQQSCAHILRFSANINSTLLSSLAVLHAPSGPCSNYSSAGCKASIRHYHAPFGDRAARTAEMRNCFFFLSCAPEEKIAPHFLGLSRVPRTRSSHVTHQYTCIHIRRTHSTPRSPTSIVMPMRRCPCVCAYV